MISDQSPVEKLPFRSYAKMIRREFGVAGRVYKVGLDARLTCPNIDGTVARGGCTFCTNPSFSFQPMDAASRRRDLLQQLREGIAYYRTRGNASAFIAYFQTFTNTYAPPQRLRELYTSVLEEPDVSGLAISTRPDAVGEDVIDVLEEFHHRTYLSVEMGLQTANDATLEAINRGHTVAQFRDAMERLTRRGLRVEVHLLFGLPGDGPADALRSVDEVNQSGATGVKLHHLQVLEGTRLGQEFRRKPFPVFTFEQYSELLGDVIARLRSDLVVDRLFATCREELVIAPHWGIHDTEARHLLISHLLERGIRQGDATSGRSETCSSLPSG